MAETGRPQTGFLRGSSTGFGRFLAEEGLKTGGSVVTTARKVEWVRDLAQKSSLRLMSGAGALRRVQQKIHSWQREIAAWEPGVVGAGFPEGQ